MSTRQRINSYKAYVWIVFLCLRPLSGAVGVKDDTDRALDGNWKFVFVGRDSSTARAGPDSPAAFESVTLPHTFPFTGAHKTAATGFGWYFRDIEAPRSFSGKDIYLDFEGVCLRAEVYIDGALAGKSDFAYLPFAINLTSLIMGKTRVRLAVRVDNRLLPRQIPDVNANGWWFYGGLTRGVRLSVRRRDRIDGAQVRTAYRAKDTFDLSVKLTPAHEAWDSVIVHISTMNKSGELLTAAMTGTDTVFRIGGVVPWTPENPFRYAFSLVPFFKGKAGDTLTIERGFCQLSARQSKLFLNGNPYYLCGMGRHDVYGGKGPLLSREERKNDLCDLKSLGVNFLRIAHFPQHRDIYELCDSLGLLVMDEIPAWKTGSRFLGSKEGRDYGAAYMKSLVAAHGNYTSVCMWSLGNQFSSFKTAVADYVGDVSAEVKNADPSRPVTFCSFYYIWDKAFSHVDIIAVNEYFGWELASLGMLGPMLDKIHNDWPGKPVLVSELGAQAARGLRNPRAKLAGAVTSIFSKDLSEDHQALFLRSHLDTIWGKRSYVNGMVVWAYADYMTNQNKARTADMPFGLNGCGIVTQDRKPKKSYAVVKDRYGFFCEQFKLKNENK